ncbi:MAG: Fur family transcriptional regulator [Chloroflexota bacterium]
MTSAAVLLRRHGLRVTPQRLLLVDIAQRLQGHFTAEQIHHHIIAIYPSVSLVSVYRGLETLREQGLVTRTALGDVAASYEWVSDTRHHHLVCTACGVHLEMDDHELDELRRRLNVAYHFQASLDHLAIFGRCNDCINAAASSEPPPPTE